MDRLQRQRRLRLTLAAGGVLAALVYLGSMAIRASSSWPAFRAEAEAEDGKAGAAALNAEHAGQVAEQFAAAGRTGEAEKWAGIMEEHRREESRHRRKAQELLGRWW